jgi:protein SCO1
MPVFPGMAKYIAVLLILMLFALPKLAFAHQDSDDKRLPIIGPAPPFALTSQDGKPIALAGLRGKVVAVTFIYTGCPDICPLLTEKMARVQDELGRNFGAKIVFVSITLDPEHDTSEVLKQYAQLFDVKPEGWAFLTGSPEAIRDAAPASRRLNIFDDHRPARVDHR